MRRLATVAGSSGPARCELNPSGGRRAGLLREYGREHLRRRCGNRRRAVARRGSPLGYLLSGGGGWRSLHRKCGRQPLRAGRGINLPRFGEHGHRACRFSPEVSRTRSGGTRLAGGLPIADTASSISEACHAPLGALVIPAGPFPGGTIRSWVVPANGRSDNGSATMTSSLN